MDRLGNHCPFITIWNLLRKIVTMTIGTTETAQKIWDSEKVHLSAKVASLVPFQWPLTQIILLMYSVQHYQNFHNVDSRNYFFQKLFEDKWNSFTPKKCLHCDEILPTTKFEIHTCAFMVYYPQELCTIQKCNYNF